MKKSFFLILSVLIVSSQFISNKVNAQTVIMPVEVHVALKKAYIPSGFDSNDRVQIVVEGYLPNTCYRLGPTKVFRGKNPSDLIVEQHAYKYSGVCLDVVVPFNRPVEFGILPEGSYNVKNVMIEANGKVSYEKVLGTVPVVLTRTTGPDDYLYAIVEDANLGTIEGERAINISGQLPGPCWKLQETKVIVESDDVITILPIITYDSAPEPMSSCSTKATVPFTTHVSLPNVKSGRYLVQIRSLNGQSVNKLFNL